jgi:hypothetical protein
MYRQKLNYEFVSSLGHNELCPYIQDNKEIRYLKSAVICKDL